MLDMEDTMKRNAGSLMQEVNSRINLTRAAESTAAAEWVRYPEAVRLFGISRSKLYELAGSGKIRTASLRDVGQTKATRLFEINSIRAYVVSCVLSSQ